MKLAPGSRTLIARLTCLLLAAMVACVPPKNGKGGGGGGTVDPKACGKIDVNDAGKKLYSFLDASAALDRATREMDTALLGACKKMAKELGVPVSGTTKQVCDTALKALDDNLKVSVKTESRLVTRTTPPVCTTDVDFQANFAASCDAKVAADIDIQCEGRCGGTCRGACEGTCQGGTGAGGECNGVCEGQCNGSCSASCDGYANVDASVDCKASAELRAVVETTCTEPKVEVVREDVTIVDDTKFQAAMRAIDVSMPTIIKVGAKAKLIGKAMVNWVTALGRLVKASGQLVEGLGDAALCAGGQLLLAMSAVADIQVRVEVSVEVTAHASASAGAS
jgi:hypothetical protein